MSDMSDIDSEVATQRVPGTVKTQSLRQTLILVSHDRDIARVGQTGDVTGLHAQLI